jgi:dihydrofolate synthase/folylpolyglutamate synthase
VVLAAQPPEAAEVLLRRCVEVGATVAREGLEFGVASRATAVGGQLVTLQGLAGTYDEMFLPLFGEHQAANAACALAAVEVFLGGGESRQIDPEAVREGLADARSPGRLEVVRTSPTVVLDAGHNPHGMTATVRALTDAFSFTQLVGVVACLGDKDVRGMLEVLEPALTSIRPTARRARCRSTTSTRWRSRSSARSGSPRRTDSTTRSTPPWVWRRTRWSTAERGSSSPAPW